MTAADVELTNEWRVIISDYHANIRLEGRTVVPGHTVTLSAQEIYYHVMYQNQAIGVESDPLVSNRVDCVFRFARVQGMVYKSGKRHA
jgi:hypothetical protein